VTANGPVSYTHLDVYKRQTVDRALGRAAVSGRFSEGDLASIISYEASAPAEFFNRADEEASLQSGTSVWEGFGR